MVSEEVINRLKECFPAAFVNPRNEIIIHPKTNSYFILENCENEFDVQCKVLEWLSRAACKSQPYHGVWRNEWVWEYHRNGINMYLGTKFSREDMYLIYTYLGNCCNHPRTEAFVKSGYDLNLLRALENNQLSFMIE